MSSRGMNLLKLSRPTLGKEEDSGRGLGKSAYCIYVVLL